ncbi:MAG TPA: hypothetical protein VMI56_17045 [Reyranella sp.]|nr:hypothetical protein [Reyranella sp.]
MPGFAPIGTLPIGAAPYVAPAAAGPSQALLLLSPVYSDAGTFSASSQVTRLPVANLQTRQPQKKWRSLPGTAASIAIALAQPIAANALALVAHNLSSAGLLRLRGALLQANVTTAPAVDTGWQSAWPITGKPAIAWPNWLSLLTWSGAPAVPYWQLDIADPSNTDGFLEAGRLILGPQWQPSIGFDLSGTPVSFDANDQQTKTPWGYIFTDRRSPAGGPARVFAVQITAANRKEVQAGILEMQRTRGLWGDVVCCLDPGRPDDFHINSLHGVFVQKGSYPITQNFDPDGGQWGVGTINLNESL